VSSTLPSLSESTVVVTAAGLRWQCCHLDDLDCRPWSAARPRVAEKLGIRPAAADVG
jgi:hypothetical protein